MTTRPTAWDLIRALLLYGWMLLRAIPVLLGVPVADKDREVSEFDRDVETLSHLLKQ